MQYASLQQRASMQAIVSLQQRVSLQHWLAVAGLQSLESFRLLRH
jgi:hypothetical protein